MEAVAVLPQLIESARLVESHADRKDQEGVHKIHRMYAPMRLDDAVYAVKLTVKEAKAGYAAEIEEVRKLYDVSLEKKMPDGFDITTGIPTERAEHPASGTSEITLRTLLEGVKDASGDVYFQPVNKGVDLGAPVSVVAVSPQFAGQNAKVLRKRFPAAIRERVLNAFNSGSGVVNEDTGKKVGMTATDFKEHLKFSDNDPVPGILQLETIVALPELMRTAKLVESYADTKKDAHTTIREMHRFQAALRIGDTDFSVKLTVKEMKNGTLAFAKDNPVKLYHHRLEKQMPAGNSEASEQGSGRHRPSASISAYFLRDLLQDVKDAYGDVYLQGRDAVRGSVTFTDGQDIVSLFQQRDASTVRGYSEE